MTLPTTHSYLDVLRSSPPAPAIERIVDLASRIFEVPYAMVTLRVGDRVVCYVGNGLSGVSWPVEDALDAVAIETDQITVLDAPHTASRFANNAFVQDEPIRFYAGVPIHSGDAGADVPPMGTLCVMDVRERSFSADDTATLRDLAALAENELPVPPVVSHTPLAILDQISDGFYTLDASWRFTYVNETALRIFRRTREELYGAVLWEVFPDVEGTRVAEGLREARRTGEPTELTTFYEPLDAWIHARIHPHPTGLAVYFRDVTEEKSRTERLLMLKQVVETALDSIVVTEGAPIDEPGPRILYVNPAFEEMTGYRAEEVLGQSPRLLQGPRTDRQVLNHVRIQLEDGEPVTDETINYRKDGTPFVIQWRIAPVHDENGHIAFWVAMQRDVTEQRTWEANQQRFTARVRTLHEIGRAILSASSAEDVAYAALQRLTRVVDHSRASVIEFDSDAEEGVVLAVTTEAETDLGAGTHIPFDDFYDLSTLSPSKIRYVPDLDVRESSNRVDDLLREEGIRSYVVAPLQAEDRVIGMLALGADTPSAFTDDDLAVVQEVADMVALALWQAQYEREIVRAKEKAEEMNQLKTSFLANMSHEVRTPLTSIIGFAEIIDNDPSSAERFASVIRDSGERLLRTLDAVLDLAQLEANVFEHHPETIDVLALTREVVDEQRDRARDNGLEFRFTVRFPDTPVEQVSEPATEEKTSFEDVSFEETPPAGEEPVSMHGDERMVRRILTNVIDNAIKFTDDGRVEVVLDVLPDAVHFRIADTGVGISDDFLPEVFDEFKQESTGDTRSHEGSGLGLTITKHFVDLINGHIDVQSSDGAGTIVHITLPR